MGHLSSNSINMPHVTLLKNGSSAHIYLENDPTNKTPKYIIKCLKDEFANVPIVKNRFETEIDILSRLKIEHIPKLNDSITHTNPLQYSYHYIPGSNLLEYRLEHPLSENESINILKQLLSILMNLHANNIVHSDISPMNIIINQGSLMNLIDFGCAQVITSEQAANTWVGHPAYMSPEQAQGYHWDHRSDLYQAGLLLFDLITGKRYNQGKTEKQQRPLAANPDITRVNILRKKHHAFITKLLAPKPDKRYQSAKEALTELNNMQNTSTVELIHK